MPGAQTTSLSITDKSSKRTDDVEVQMTAKAVISVLPTPLAASRKKEQQGGGYDFKETHLQ